MDYSRAGLMGVFAGAIAVAVAPEISIPIFLAGGAVGGGVRLGEHPA